jgi:Zn-dependent protease
MGNLDLTGMLDMALRVAAVLLCIMVHEVSHGLAAYLLGDPTAKAGRRLSFNPLRHIDPFGAIMMVVAGFGWAKPVPVDMRRFKNPKIGMAVTALAGPLSNFVLAYVSLCFILRCFRWPTGRLRAGCCPFCWIFWQARRF